MLCAWCGVFVNGQLLCDKCWNQVFQKLDSWRILVNQVYVCAGFRWLPNQILVNPLVNRLKWITSQNEARLWAKLKWHSFVNLLKLHGYEGQPIYWIPTPSLNNPKRSILLACAMEEIFGGHLVEAFEKSVNLDFKKFKLKKLRQFNSLQVIQPKGSVLGSLPVDAFYVLVDDIITTGQTLTIMSQHIQSYGIGKILAVTWFNRIIMPQEKDFLSGV